MTAADKFAEEYAKEYLGKVFYFCLKKTGDPQEAEDLASEISVSVLRQLRRGNLPEHPSAWVWKIARSRYSDWAEAKRKRTAAVCSEDISELPDVKADSSEPERDVLQQEDFALLRRELAFLSTDYRELLIAFYIEDRSIREIAERLHLSVEAVKSRLFRARNILKEGMNMARTFGPKSYKPEEVTFTSSGSQPSGLPFSAVQRKTPKNILLEASDNPSTAEELSMALGIALPYMEEEIELLHNATLLDKEGDKYVTNFVIESRQCQQEVYDAQRRDSKERSALIHQIASDSLASIRGTGIVRGKMSDADLKWWVATHLVDLTCDDARTALGWMRVFFNPKARANGETWGFIGREWMELGEPLGCNHSGCWTPRGEFWMYGYSDFELWCRVGLMEKNELLLLIDLLESRKTVETLTELEKTVWNAIDGRFAHADETGRVVPDVLVIPKAAMTRIDGILQAHPLYGDLLDRVLATFDGVRESMERNLPKRLHGEIPYATSMDMCHLRMMAVNDLVASGGLIVPAAPEKSTLSMWLELP
ncbi:MAG: sigma-70 family RNA polymerase sigma factor [Oscillospiraceae bacterium]|nr:sigma-70 family RNA polymerase sigma factor [Oscillospiraceae bacterium]